MTRTRPLAEKMHEFEHDLRLRGAPPQHGDIDRTLLVRTDAGDDGDEQLFARVDGNTITAFVHFLPRPPIDGAPCVNLGCCVPEAYQSQGLATGTIQAAIAELTHRYARAGVPKFYVETFVLADNAASRRLAERVVSPELASVADPFSGLPAYRYLREVSTTPT